MQSSGDGGGPVANPSTSRRFGQLPNNSGGIGYAASVSGQLHGGGGSGHVAYPSGGYVGGYQPMPVYGGVGGPALQPWPMHYGSSGLAPYYPSPLPMQPPPHQGFDFYARPPWHPN